MTDYGGHPGRKTIAAVASGCGSPDDELWLNEHLNHCTDCYLTYEAERRTGSCPAVSRSRLFPSRSDRPVKARNPDSATPRGIDSRRRAANRRTAHGESRPAVKRSGGFSITKTLTNRAVSIVPASQRDRYEEEWRADLMEIDASMRKICWVLWVRFYAAYKLRNWIGLPLASIVQGA